MTVATTATYDELVLEVEFTASSGTYVSICGITGVTVNRTTELTTSEVPDCDDSTLPHHTQRAVRSIGVTISGTGVWANERHQEMHDWFYGGQTKNVRIRNTYVENNGASGDPYQESGAAYLTQLNNDRPADKGRISAEISIEFDGTPSVTDVA